jgi:CHAT domain-containing protein/tetratricopeptide (TPR) repeat protein
VSHQIKQYATSSRRKLPHAYRRIILALSLLLISVTVTQARTRFVSSVMQQGTVSSSAGQGEQEERTLESGRPIERELTGGAVHSYRITLGAGQYMAIRVEQQGIDVLVALRGPDSAPLVETDESGQVGVEELSWEAASAGRYVVEVRAVAKEAAAGRYEVGIERAAAASNRDRARIAAQRLCMEGRQGRRAGGGAELEKAARAYGAAVEKWREVGDRRWEGQTQNNLGNIYWSLSQNEKALESFEQALAIMRDTKNRNGEGLVLNNLGNIYRNLSQYGKALDYYEQALVILRESKNRNGEGLALNGLGNVYQNLSQYEKAREYFERALVIRREARNRDGEAGALNNLGNIYRLLSQNEKALKSFEQVLAIVRETKNRNSEGQALNNLGTVYQNLSQHEKAREYYERALAIKRERKDKQGEAGALINLGTVYRELSQDERAREYFERALVILRETKNRLGEAVTLNNLGNVHRNPSQYEKSLDYYKQALAIMREIRNRDGEAGALNNLGIVYRLLSQHEKAREHYERALTIRREIKDRYGEGSSLNNLGEVYRLLSQYEKAREHYEQALTIRREIGDGVGEADTLLRLAALERDHGNLPDALRLIESSLAVIENMRTRYANQELRSVYFSTVQDHYEFYIDLLMRLHKQRPSAGHDAAALQVSERSRARSLLDTLAEAGADIRQGVEPQMVASERALQQQLNAKAQLQLKLLSGLHTAEQASAIAKEIEDLTTEYQTVKAQIRRNSPRYAKLTQPVSLGLKEIQQLLDPNTLLLEYTLGEERSYLWVVSRTAMTSYELPKRAEIERSARRVYVSLSMSNATADDGYAEEANSLSRMLIGPAAARLGKKRLLIVSDGYLQYLPFAALPAPQITGGVSRGSGGRRLGRATSASPTPPLIVEHEIVSLPSASLLGVLRRELTGRNLAPKMIAVLADPVFDRDDVRVKPEAGKQASEDKNRENEPQDANPSTALQLPSELERSARDAGGLSFERLRSSREEADEIVGLARGGESLKALDFDASRATALSEELGRYRIVHFATHGLLNSLHPELSGLVLSLVDERGQPQDGFLRAHEVYNLKLGADLVVLSACQTALGKEVRGEGLIGLTRGFMYAGSPRVVASLWRVPSKATAELMKRFYRGMLVEGLHPAAALRVAQVGMLKEKRWNEPYYWAAFVLQGEWQ